MMPENADVNGVIAFDSEQDKRNRVFSGGRSGRKRGKLSAKGRKTKAESVASDGITVSADIEHSSSSSPPFIFS